MTFEKVKGRVWGTVLAVMLILQIASLGFESNPVYASHHFLWWPDGSSFTTFGGNEAIIIDTGAIEFIKGCPEGTNDFLFPFADIYIVPSGSVSFGSTLTDVGNSINTVQGVSGGIFVEEFIGVTGPSGAIPKGTFAIVYDECQDGKFDSNDLLVDPAFNVVIPTNVPPIDPSIVAFKAQSAQEAMSMTKMQNDIESLIKEIDLAKQLKEVADCLSGFTLAAQVACLTIMVAKKGIEEIKSKFANLPKPEEVMKNIAKLHYGNAIKHYDAIAKDPPDPNFNQLSPLGPTEHVSLFTEDAILLTSADVVNSVIYEEVLAEALLHSIERYQGADAASNGDMALVHVKAAKSYANSLSEQLALTNLALSSFNDAISSDTRDLDGIAVAFEALRDRVSTSDFNDKDIRAMKNLGLTDPEISEIKNLLFELNLTGFSKANVQSSISELMAANVVTMSTLNSLVIEMETIENTLQGDPLVEQILPLADAGGPYSVNEGSLLALNGAASLASPGRSIVSWEWDLDGDAVYDDAFGETPEVSFQHKFDGLVGLMVTDNVGDSGIGYARISVASVNNPPSIDNFSPIELPGPVVIGNTQSFSILVSDPDGDTITAEWFVNGESQGNGLNFDYQPLDDIELGVKLVQVKVSDDNPLGGSLTKDWEFFVVRPDADEDGWRDNVDCDDSDLDVNPSMPEIVGNSKDDDCNSSTLDSGNPPTTENLQVTTNEDTQVDIMLEAQDPDFGQTIVFSILTNPLHGTLSGTAPNLTYTPDAGFIGFDSFTYKVNDGIFDSNISTVDVTVQLSRPVANDQNISTNKDTSVDIILTAIDPNKDPLLLSVMSPPTHGTLSSISLPIPSPVGMIARWHGDGNADDIVNANHGALQNGATFAEGKVGDAFSFDGIDDYVSIPDNDLWAFGTNDFTIDLWAKFNSVKSSSPFAPGEIFVAHDSGEGLQRKWLFAYGGGMLFFHTVSRDCFCFLAPAPFSPDVDQWYHLALTKSGETYSIFVNGNSVSSHTVDRAGGIPIPNVNAPLTIGWAEGPGFVDGMIDEVQFYNRALSQSEIQEIFNAGSLGKIQPGLARGLVTYTPESNYAGPDNFTFKANDGFFESNVATISIDVTQTPTQVPVANDQSVETSENASIDIILSGSDPDGNPLTLSIVNQPAHGTLSMTEVFMLTDKWGSFCSLDSNNDGVFNDPSPTCVDPDADGPLELGDGQFNGPHNIAFDSSGDVYVGDASNHRLQKFASDGTFIKKWGSLGSADGQLSGPTGVATDSSDNVYVAENSGGSGPGDLVDNHRISKFTKDGVFLTKWGSGIASGDGQFHGPWDVDVDSFSNVYASDQHNHRVQKFDDNGVFLGKWGSLGSADGQFSGPVGIATDFSDNVYVSDGNNGRVQKFTSDGTFITKWSTPVSGIDVDFLGDVYVGGDKVRMFSSTGTLITSWGSFCNLSSGIGCVDPDGDGPLDFGDGQFNQAVGVAVNSEGTVYVTDYGNNRMQVFEKKVPSCVTPPSGMISWWTGNDNANDIVDSNNGLLENGAFFAPGKVGSAFVFDGVDDQLRIPHNANQNTGAQITVDAWIMPDVIGHGEVIINKRTPSNLGDGGFTFETTHAPFENNNGLQFGIGTISSSAVLKTAANVITTGVFQHVAATYDGTMLRIYVNGAEVASAPFSGDIKPNTPDLVIGRNSVIPDFAFDGIIDEVELFNRALSASEIKAIFEAGPLGKCTTPTVGHFTYTPDLNFNGNDSFTFKVNDGQSDSNVATVSITVNPTGGVNNAPVADNQILGTNVNTPLPLTLTGSDGDGDGLTFSQVTGPTNGQLVMTGIVTCNATVPNLCSVPATYTPDSDYIGPDSFTFKVNDGQSDSNVATVSLTVNPIDEDLPVNDDPVANDDNVSTNENTTLDISFAEVLANDTDPDDDALSVTAVGAATHGLVSIVGDAIRYVPENGFNGMDAFTYDISDGHGGTATATVSVNIIPVNDGPILQPINDQVVDEGVTLNVSVSATDPDGTIPTLSASGLPSFASFIDNNDGSGTINISPGFSDAGNYQSVEIVASDGTLTDTKTFTIIVNNVNNPPIANDQSVSINQNTPVLVDLTGSDLDQDSLSFSTVSEPTSGMLFGSGQNMIYQPDQDFVGEDSFRFLVNDGTLDSNIATVSINVVPGNNAPSFDVPPTPARNTIFNIFRGEPFSFDVQCSDSDSSDTVVIGSFTLPTDAVLTPQTPTGNPAVGTFSWTPTTLETIIMTLICADSNGIFVEHLINMIVNEPPVTNEPPVADNDVYSVDKGGTLDVSAPGVLDGDSDPNADPLSALLVSGPANAISFTLNADGSFQYTHDGSDTTSDSFTYKANDGMLDSNIATVSITVNVPIIQGKITGGGAQLDKDTNFGFNVQSTDGITINGQLEYKDKSMNINLHSVMMTSFNISVDKIKGEFSGTATVNKESGFTFIVEVEDNGEPGRNDKFKITIPELSYMKSGDLKKGNIQIHK